MRPGDNMRAVPVPRRHVHSDQHRCGHAVRELPDLRRQGQLRGHLPGNPVLCGCCREPNLLCRAQSVLPNCGRWVGVHGHEHQSELRRLRHDVRDVRDLQHGRERQFVLRKPLPDVCPKHNLSANIRPSWTRM
jgi:hypothetical protein